MKMRSAESIGEMIRSRRERSGLSQHALAELAEVGKTSISHIEKGKPTVRLATLLAVLRTLNTELVLDGPLMAESSANHECGTPAADGREQPVRRARVCVMDKAGGWREKHEAGRFVLSGNDPREVLARKLASLRELGSRRIELDHPANRQLKLAMGFAVEPMERDKPTLAFVMPLKAE